jgi:ribosomal protein S18 acetylase RimI-like enzyme
VAGFDIGVASEADLPTILAIQREAFRAEAELVGNPGLGPVAETLGSILSDLRGALILRARGPGGETLGSVRARRVGQSTEIFKLSVDPNAQGKGVATALLRAAEGALPSPRLFLRTRKGNERAISLYLRLGYAPFKEELLEQGLTFLFLEKALAQGGQGSDPRPGL